MLSLSILRYTECSVDDRKGLIQQYFTDTVQDAEMLQALRLSGATRREFAFVYSFKCKTTQQTPLQDITKIPK